jgi:DNA-binding response OmpR family regulator
LAKVLIIEDDIVLGDALSVWLNTEGHRVERTANGADGLQLLLQSGFDLALVDWQLPDMEGPDICKRYRLKGGKTPILMMTKKDQIDDKETGLDSGADDYLPKPFEIRELGARVRALLRRSTGLFDASLNRGQVSLNYGLYQITIRGKCIQLVPREFEVFEFLLRNAGQYVPSDKIIAHVWDSEADVGNEALRSCILRLRRKIDGDPDQEPVIQSRKSMGYMVSAAYALDQANVDA